MSISSTLKISSASLGAQRLRLQTIASNMANAKTTRTEEGGPYKRRMPVFEAAALDPFAEGLEAELNLVQVADVWQSDAPPERVYDPNHPDADAEGYVNMPAINVLDEMVDLMATARTYEANANVIDVTKTMARSALGIGRG